jgi:hypothetical protein
LLKNWFLSQGAGIAKEVLEEARELALKEHNFEFATNMWVAESFTNQVTAEQRLANGQVSGLVCR